MSDSKKGHKSKHVDKGASVVDGAAITLQASIRSRNAQLELQNIENQQSRREKILLELRATEETYVAGLSTLVNEVINPLRGRLKAGQPIVDAATLNALFPQNAIEMIFQINMQFLSDLISRLSKTDPSQRLIGDVLLKMCDMLRVYTVYVDCYPGIEETLSKMRKDKAFIAFLEVVFKTTDVQLLASLLITPIQRIPRYQMLLVEVTKMTHPSHPDHRQLSMALEKMITTAHYVNDHAKAADNAKKIVKIDEALDGMKTSIVDPRRVLVKQGEIDQFSKGEWKARYFFLFNDLLIRAREGKKAASPEDQKYTFLEKVPLKHVTVNDVSSTTQTEVNDPNPGKVFELFHPHPIHYILRCTTIEERNDWMTLIRRSVETIENEDKFLEEERLKVAREKAKQASLIIASQYKTAGQSGGTGTLRSRLAAAKKNAGSDVDSGAESSEPGTRAYVGSRLVSDMSFEERQQHAKRAAEEIKEAEAQERIKQQEVEQKAKETQEAILAHYAPGSRSSVGPGAPGGGGTLRERMAAGKTRNKLTVNGPGGNSPSGRATWNGKTFAQMTDEEREEAAAAVERELEEANAREKAEKERTGKSDNQVSDDGSQSKSSGQGKVDSSLTSSDPGVGGSKKKTSKPKDPRHLSTEKSSSDMSSSADSGGKRSSLKSSRTKKDKDSSRKSTVRSTSEAQESGSTHEAATARRESEQIETHSEYWSSDDELDEGSPKPVKKTSSSKTSKVSPLSGPDRSPSVQEEIRTISNDIDDLLLDMVTPRLKDEPKR